MYINIYIYIYISYIICLPFLQHSITLNSQRKINADREFNEMDLETRKAILRSIYMKIFLNYLQIVSLSQTLDFNWNEILVNLFQIQQSAGDLTEQAFSVDCFLKGRIYFLLRKLRVWGRKELETLRDI